jgi:homoserine O-acetyltransferase
MKILQSQVPFKLESGEILPELTIGYHTYGTLNPEGSNVVWVFHALTANSDAAEWWSGLIGSEKQFDPAQHFIICANILGSCYGTSGPLVLNPETKKPYHSTFPRITIRDIVRAHEILRTELGISKIQIGIGGSMGGYQALEWAYSNPNLFQNLILLVTGAAESAWGKAIHTTQRMAIETDPTWKEMNQDAGKKGMETARGFGMITYRNYAQFVDSQRDESPVLTNSRAESYIRYQAEKLSKRFNAYSYWLLTNAMDSHDLGRGRSSLKVALSLIKTECLIIGVETDFLCPVAEQKKLSAGLINSTYVEIQSPYGHDGFLIESEQISEAISEFLF